MKCNRLPSLVLFVVGLTLLTSARLGAQADSFRWSRALPPGGWLHVFSGAGAIHVVAWDQDEVRVVGQREGSGPGRDRVRFEATEVGDAVVVCSVADYAECGVDGIGLRDPRRSHRPQEVRFTVYVPPGVHLRVSTGVGDVNVEGVGGHVMAETGNGHVTVGGTSASVSVSSGNGNLRVERATGPILARTGNGSITVLEASESVSARSDNGTIEVSLRPLSGQEEFEFRTANGDIVLFLPASPSLQLSARLSNGELRSDFPITLAPRVDERELRGTLGQGGPDLVAISGSGDLLLRTVREPTSRR